MANKIGVRGLAECEAVLNALPERLARTVVTSGLRAGATVIARIARNKVKANSSDTGALASKIGTKSAKPNGQGQARVSVGIRSGGLTLTPKGRTKPRRIVPRRTAHMVEFGTKHSAADPFMRPAGDEGAGEAVKRMAEVIGRGLDREATALATGKKSMLTGRKL